MSYEIVKGLKIDKKNKIVKIKSSSSNVYPKTFDWWDSPTLTTIFKEKGLKEVQKEILYNYWCGNFQKTNNNYEKSLILLDKMKYNWDTVKKYDEIENLKELLYENYIKYNNRKKGDFYIMDNLGNYIYKIIESKYFYGKNLLSKFKYSSKEEALYKLKRNIYNYQDFKIVEL